MSSYSSKHGSAPSYVSSPPWSLNSLTSTVSGTPSTPVRASLPLTPPPSAGSSRTYYHNTSTPGAPFMGSVPLPNIGLQTPPVSPHAMHALQLDPELLQPTARLDLENYRPSANRRGGCPATHPPTNSLYLNVAGCQVRVINTNAPVVTVQDVINALYNHAYQLVPEEHFRQLHRQQQAAVTAKYNVRMQRYPQAPQGIRQIDFIPATGFAGLSPAADGTWIVHLC